MLRLGPVPIADWTLHFLAMCLGSAVGSFNMPGGIAVGAIPGLSTTMSIALLLPFTFVLDPTNGMTLLLGIYFASVYSGSIPAILLRLPGTPASAATLLDGYPLTQQGKAGKALTISLLASVVGGVVGGILLLFF